MLLTRKVLDEIVAGRIDLVFRRWQKPTVKAGGRLRTAVGELAIGSVDIVDPAVIGDRTAQRAGFDSADALRADLFRERPSGGQRARVAKPTEASVIYRVEVAFAGVDARASMRETLLDDAALADVLGGLARIDQRCVAGPWTQRVLALLEAWPARRAPELAEMEGRATLPFKTDVRKLKELGLTESLTVGYRLSPRGVQVLAALKAKS